MLRDVGKRSLRSPLDDDRDLALWPAERLDQLGTFPDHVGRVQFRIDDADARLVLGACFPLALALAELGSQREVLFGDDAARDAVERGGRQLGRRRLGNPGERVFDRLSVLFRRARWHF